MKQIYEDIKYINKIDPADVSLRLNKLFEESGELAQAVNKTLGRKHHEEDVDALVSSVIEEAADTIQCVMSVLAEYDVDYVELTNMIMLKNMKWKSYAKINPEHESETEKATD